MHPVSAFAAEARLVLGQSKVDGKSNDISALPTLPRLLSLDGCIVTADAMHCQKETARTILAQGGDYVLALKGNQKGLLEEVRLYLDDPANGPDDVATTTDGDHGRIETREARIIHDVAWLKDADTFPGLKAVGKVVAWREIDGATTTATPTYLLSNPFEAKRFLDIVRTH